MLEIIKDERGFLSLFDSLLAVFLLFIVFIAFNMVMEIEVPSLSEENSDFKTSQDLMDILSSKATDRDHSTLETISYILDYNNNSLSSQREVTGYWMNSFRFICPAATIPLQKPVNWEARFYQPGEMSWVVMK